MAVAEYTTLTVTGTIVEKDGSAHAIFACCTPTGIDIAISNSTVTNNVGNGVNVAGAQTLTIARTEFSHNAAASDCARAASSHGCSDGDGCGNGQHAAAVAGAGVRILATAWFSVTDSTFDSNENDDYDGGGLLTSGSAGIIKSTSFRSNKANGEGNFGGGAYVMSDSVVAFEDVEFVNNMVNTYGSGLYVESSSSVTLTRTAFESNTVTGSGGAMYVYESSATLRNATFRDNSCVGQAGASLSSGQNADIVMEDVLFEGNFADPASGVQGSAIYSTTGSIITGTRVDFRNNVAAKGTVRLSSANLDCTDCAFVDNHAGTGSALSLSSGASATLRSSHLSGNNGSSVFQVEIESSLRVRASTVADTPSGVVVLDTTSNDFAVELDTVEFVANPSPAIVAAGQILLQNCRGLSPADIANVSVGACALTEAYCMPEACADWVTGTNCTCIIDGVETPQPVGCMESGELEIGRRGPSPGRPRCGPTALLFELPFLRCASPTTSWRPT